MAYNDYLADRISQFFKEKSITFTEKNVWWTCFMVDEKMCVGVMQDEIMARINPDVYEDLYKKEVVKK